MRGSLGGARTGATSMLCPHKADPRRNLLTSSTRSPRPVKKRVRPAPKEPLPSTANARRPGACASTSLQRLRVALTRRGNRRLEDDRATEHIHDRERMTVAVRVDTDDIVH